MALNLLCPDFENFLSQSDVIKLIYDLIWVYDELEMEVDIFEAIPNCIFPEEISKREFSFLRRKCQAGVTTIAIGANGNVRPCTHNIDSYGNILQQDFSEIWDSMSDWKGESYLPNECKDCKSLDICFGGCRITAKGFDNNVKAKDPWMTDPMDKQITFSKKEFLLSEDMKISIGGKLQFRQDGDTYLVNINGQNSITRVNKEFFNLIHYLTTQPEISLINLSQSKEVYDSENFQKVIKLLLRKKIIQAIA
jgi:radical SAM protein with 4Fe4S-binding SPASM domain